MAALFVVGCKEEAKDETSENNEAASANVDNKDTGASAKFDLWDEDLAAVFYLDANSLVEKSGLTENQRKMLGAELVKDIEDVALQRYLMNTIANIDDSGLKLSEPIYATISTDEVGDLKEFVIVAKVSDADILDEFTPNMELKFERDGDLRYATNDDETSIIGYNEEYFVLAISNEDSADLLARTMDNADMDLSAFRGHDIAAYFNMSKIYPIFDNGAEIATVLGEELKLIAGLTFEAGRIVIDVEYSGNNDQFADVCRVLDNNNLKHIASDAIAFMNIGIDGEGVVEAMEEYLTEEREKELAKSLGMNRNGLVATLEVVYGIIGSIDGDLALSLNDLDVTTRYTYEYGEAESHTDYDIDASLIANVSNNYIIENVPMLQGSLGNMFKKESKDRYKITLGSNEINIGQVDNLFRVGVNEPCDNTPADNMHAKWSAEFDNSIAYVVLDIHNFANSKFGQKRLREVRNEMNYEERIAFNEALEIMDCIWLNIRDDKRIELVLSLEDSETNALEQSLALAMSTYIK